VTIGYKNQAGYIHFVSVTSDPIGRIIWTNELQNPPGFAVFLFPANKGFWLTSIVTNCACFGICQRLLIGMIFHLRTYPSFSCDADISSGFQDASHKPVLPEFRVFFFDSLKPDLYLNSIRNSVPTSRKHCVFIKTANLFLVLREIIVVHSEKLMEHVRSVCLKKAEHLNI
jgi:hypothetical protein